jgi:cytochrome b6-f complex iron-sulfur subunit
LVFAALRGVSTGDWLTRSAPLSLSLLDARFTEQGDATYIVVKDDGSIENYGINAVCTHLGCVVPWNKAENKFKCPCHGSQYNNEGKVIRGPAPLSLALAHAEINDSDDHHLLPLDRDGLPHRPPALVEVSRAGRR